MSGSNVLQQPIVIFGGFLSFTMLYEEMRQSLSRLSGQPVTVVETHSYDWLPSVTRSGWVHLLGKLNQTIRQAAGQSPTGKVILIGHSAGGVLARLYLSPHPFHNHHYNGLRYVSDLITLGSPHYNRGNLTRGGPLSRWVEKHYPGACWSPRVSYTAIAGKLRRGNLQGPLPERWSYKVYDSLDGDGAIWGDGLIPVRSALLQGAYPLILEGVSHFKGFGGPWYGQEEVLATWWPAWVKLHGLSARRTVGQTPGSYLVH